MAKKIKPIATALCIKDWAINDLVVFKAGNSYPVVNRLEKWRVLGLEIMGKGRTTIFWSGSEYFEVK